MKTRFNRLLLIAATLITSSLAHAGAARTYDCTEIKGAKLSFESERSRQRDGYTTGETLRGNLVRIQFEGETIAFEPDKSLSNSNGAVMAAFSFDGQYVIINALYNTMDPGDLKTFEGDIDMRVKTKDGELVRRAGTPVVCQSLPAR